MDIHIYIIYICQDGIGNYLSASVLGSDSETTGQQSRPAAPGREVQLQRLGQEADACFWAVVQDLQLSFIIYTHI